MHFMSFVETWMISTFRIWKPNFYKVKNLLSGAFQAMVDTKKSNMFCKIWNIRQVAYSCNSISTIADLASVFKQADSDWNTLISKIKNNIQFRAIRECQMGIRDELFISQSKIQCNNFLKQNLIKFKILPQLFSKCVLHKYKIFIYGSFLKRTCYSYHTLKNEYKLICKYPSDIAPFFRYMYVFVNDIILFFGRWKGKFDDKEIMSKAVHKEEYDALIMIINGYGDEEDVL
ncbi:hypothetical protein RFI_29778, partial [Reticulomyxa filosa]